METDELKMICKEWYYNDNVAKRNFVAWEILKDVRRHSCDFKGKEKAMTRFYHIGNFGYLLGQLKARFVDTDNPAWDFFKSTALIRVTNNNDERANVKEDFDNLIYGFNLNFDLENSKKKRSEDDVIDVSDVHKECKKLKSFFDKNKIPYILKFTGRGGFRLIILWDDLKDYFKVEDFGEVSGQFGDFIVKQSKIDPNFVDEGVLHASGMALIRVLYSIHPKSGLVCYPLDNDEFENFSTEKMKASYILDNLTVVKGSKPLDKKREGDLSIIYNEFSKANKKQLSKVDQKREKEKLESIGRKQEALEKLKALPEKERKEILDQLK